MDSYNTGELNNPGQGDEQRNGPDPSPVRLWGGADNKDSIGQLLEVRQPPPHYGSVPSLKARDEGGAH